MVTRVAVVGASGRLGSLACTLIEQQSDLTLVARLDSRSDLGEMLGADVVLDVTTPGVSPTVVDHAVRAGLKVLVGTSGWNEDRVRTLRTLLQAHPDAGVVVIPNFSLGSVLATHFATIAARYFESIEIVETHHAAKVDSPSGTAVRTAELIGRARAELGPVVAPHTDQRARGQQVASVPIHSLRLQGAVARQDVHFGGTGEVLTLTHETLSPSSYEAGILLGLRAALETTGLVVGLDALIGLGTSVSGSDSGAAASARSANEPAAAAPAPAQAAAAATVAVAGAVDAPAPVPPAPSADFRGDTA